MWFFWRMRMLHVVACLCVCFFNSMPLRFFISSLHVACFFDFMSICVNVLICKISKVFGAFFHFCMVDVIGCYIWKAQGLLFVSATVSFAYAVTQLNHNLILHGRTLLKSCDMCDYFLQTLCKQAFYKLERNLVCLYMPNMRV